MSQIWTLIKQAIVNCWHLFQGIFLFSWQWRKQKKLTEQLDLKFHYKQKLNKHTNMQSVQEKNMFASELRKLSRADRKNYAVFNYITTIVFRMRPGMTMKDGIKEFYTAFHPWFLSYYGAFKIVVKIARSKDPKKTFEQQLPQILAFKTRTDVFARAEHVLNLHKEAAKSLKLEADKFKKKKMEKTDSVDKEMLKIEQEIIEERIKRDKDLAKNLKNAIEDASKKVED